jgi:hypothetical protein
MNGGSTRPIPEGNPFPGCEHNKHLERKERPSPCRGCARFLEETANSTSSLRTGKTGDAAAGSIAQLDTKFRAPLAGHPIGDFGSLHQGVEPQLLAPIDF